MTTLHIPDRWLQPKKKSPREWLFQCSDDLPTLVQTHRAGRYFRQLIHLLEKQHHIFDYHLTLLQNSTPFNHLEITVYFGDPRRTVNPSDLPVCISCETAHELSAASLISEQQHTRAWLDARGRYKLIVTPTRHVERLTQLTDGEMDALWKDAVDLIDREAGSLDGFYPTLAINHGTYRNHAHLHLKISFRDDVWKPTIAPRYQEKLEQINQLLQDPTIVADCFGTN